MRELDQRGEQEARTSRDQADRRREPRVPTDEAASMRVVDSWSSLRVNVRVLEVSRNGLKLSVPRFLNQGTVIQIHREGSMALAEVRHCASAGSACRAGVLLRDVFPEPVL